MDGGKNDLTADAQGEVLGSSSKTLQREVYNLTSHPDWLWQQICNRLQWGEGEQEEGPMTEVIAYVR